MTRRRSLSELLGDPPTKRAGRPVEDHRQKLVLEQAEHTRLKNAKLRGELLDAKAVEAKWTAAVLDARNAFLALPSRIGSRLSLTPAQLVVVDAEIRDVLDALAGDEGAADG